MAEPELSIVVAASHAAHTLAKCLDALGPQIAAVSTEVLVVASTDVEARLAHERLPGACVLQAAADALIPTLWGMGVSAARGRVLALTVATCVPDAQWVDAIVRAHTEYHTAVGGAIENAPVASLLDWAQYFVLYTPFMLPFEPGPLEVPGENGTYKRAALAEQMNWIRAHGFWASEINARLREEKRSLWGDPRLVVYHQPSCSLLGFARQRFAHGRLAGCRRAARSTRYQRLRDMLRAPAGPLIHLARMVKRLARKRRHRTQFVLSLPVVIWFLLCWAAGEWLGLLSGAEV
jgi:hypothetical protein